MGHRDDLLVTHNLSEGKSYHGWHHPRGKRPPHQQLRSHGLSGRDHCVRREKALISSGCKMWCERQISSYNSSLAGSFPSPEV